MSDTKFIKQIQTRLSRKGIKASYADIRPFFCQHCSESNPTEAQLSATVEALIKLYQPTGIITAEADNNLPQHEEILSVEDGEAFKEPEQTEEVLSTLDDTAIAETESLPLETPSSFLAQRQSSLQQGHHATTITSPEAVEIIQEIAADDTSRNQTLAQQMLSQAHEKTDSIVALIAAMPEIESEMLKRKLQRMPRKQVDYAGVVDSYFREGRKLTHFVASLAAEYGVSL